MGKQKDRIYEEQKRVADAMEQLQRRFGALSNHVMDRMELGPKPETAGEVREAPSELAGQVKALAALESHEIDALKRRVHDLEHKRDLTMNEVNDLRRATRKVEELAEQLHSIQAVVNVDIPTILAGVKDHSDRIQALERR
jgi:uncharacterized protein YaaN involved in tellurite resistance